MSDWETIGSVDTPTDINLRMPETNPAYDMTPYQDPDKASGFPQEDAGWESIGTKGWETISKKEPPKTSFSPDDIPGMKPESKPRKEYSNWEKLVGAEEATVATVAGMVMATIGTASGALAGLATQSGAKRGGMGEQVAEYLMEQSWQPRTPAGQEYAQNVGDVFRESGAAGLMFGGAHIAPIPEGAAAFAKSKILPSKAKVALETTLKDKPVREDVPSSTHVQSWEEQIKTDETIPTKTEDVSTLSKEQSDIPQEDTTKEPDVGPYVWTEKDQLKHDEMTAIREEQNKEVVSKEEVQSTKEQQLLDQFTKQQEETRIKELSPTLHPDERIKEIGRLHKNLATWRDVGHTYDPELAKITDAHQLIDHITNKLGEDHFIPILLDALKKNLPKTKVETISKEAYQERYLGEPADPLGEDWTGKFKTSTDSRKIYLKQGTGENLETAAHELVHAAISDKVEQARQLPESHPTRVRYESYVKTLEGISKDLQTDINAKNPKSSVSYAISDIQELPTMGLTNPAVIHALSLLPSKKGRTYVSKIVRAVSDFLGFHSKQRTAFHDLLDSTLNVAKAKRTDDENVAGNFEYHNPGLEIKSIPHASSVGDMADFNAKGKEVLKEHGKEAANRFAKDVLTWKRNQDMGIPKDTDGLSDILYRLGKNKEADKVQTTERLQEASKEGVTLDMKIRWREFAEGTRKELDSQEMQLFNKYYAPEAQERAAILRSLQDKGWVLPLEMDAELTGSNVARMTLPPELGPVTKVSVGLGKHKFSIPVKNKILGETLRYAHQTGKKLIGGDMGGFNLDAMAPTGGAKERGLFAAEFPSGQRIVVQVKGKDLVEWKATKTEAGTIEPKMKGFLRDVGPVKAGDKLRNITIKEATIAELEKHSPYKYNKDSQAVLYQRTNELREFYRGKQMMENLKKSDFFLGNEAKEIKGIAHKTEPGVPLPEGFRRPSHLDKLPELDGYAFEKNVSYIIEDFARVYTPNILTNISSVLIKNMMLNPIPHMMNEAWHLYNARGLTGWFTPAGVYRFTTTGRAAVKEVAQMGPQFRSLLRDGASLLSSDVRNNHIAQQFLDKGAKEFVESPEGKSWASKLGTSTVDLYNTISHGSSKWMWMVRDAMYMQMIKEKMLKGMSQKDAIQEVERHMPAYKVPTTVMGSRSVSQVLQNPNVTVFSRYHYGMMRSLVETTADITGKNGKEAFKQGVDTALAITLAIAVLYPMQDMLAKALTGNNDAEVRRAGPYHPAMAIAEIAKGEKDPQAFMASVFTFNPMLLYGAQLLANRKLYNGQPVYHPTDDPRLIAKDIAKYSYTQVPQISTSVQVMDDKRGGGAGQWIAKQFDIKSPTKADVKAKEAIKKKLEVASKNRARKELGK